MFEMFEKYRPCRKCRYYCFNCRCCNYLKMTGRLRTLDGGKLLPDGTCRLYEEETAAQMTPAQRGGAKKKQRDPEKAKHGRNSPNQYFLMWLLYRDGWLDNGIAMAAGVGIKTVWIWRQRNGFESNFHPKKEKKGEDDET